MASHSMWGFQVEIDEQATARWYAQAEAWCCDCGYCRNFVTIAKQRGLPAPVMETLDSLGIPPEKATYVCYLCTDEKGDTYQFSYRIAGNMLNAETHNAISLDWGEAYCGHEAYPYGAPNFPQPHFDLAFFVVLPWVLDEPADGR